MTIPESLLFHLSPHNLEIDELFHQFRDANITNVLSLALKPRAYERISLIPDFFSDSVPRFIKDNTPSSSPHADLRIGILHLDGDFYDSVYFPLVALERYIQPGGLVVFDDFLLTDNPSEDTWPGARRAYDDFMSEFSNNYVHIDNIRGVAVLCKNS